jgi:hypothetical protein
MCRICPCSSRLMRFLFFCCPSVRETVQFEPTLPHPAPMGPSRTLLEIVVVCIWRRNASRDQRIVGMLPAQRSTSVMPVPDTIAPPEY